MTKNKENFKILGESAIHDNGFQLCLTINIKYKIKNFIRDMETLSECISTHEKWKKENWYNAKTTVNINENIDGYEMFHPFTYKLAKKVYAERKIKYDLLIDIAEETLQDSKRLYSENSSSNTKPFREDLDREFVIVDYVE